MSYSAKQQHPTPNLLRWPQVEQKVGLSRPRVYALIAQRKFPAPIRISDRASAWLEPEINEWIELKIKHSRPSK